jgi:hypothetical protein
MRSFLFTANAGILKIFNAVSAPLPAQAWYLWPFVGASGAEQLFFVTGNPH